MSNLGTPSTHPPFRYCLPTFSVIIPPRSGLTVTLTGTKSIRLASQEILCFHLFHHSHLIIIAIIMLLLFRNDDYATLEELVNVV